MLHKNWLQTIQRSLDEIKEKYPNSSNSTKSEWKRQFRDVKKTCDHILEAWVIIEEQLATLLKNYPELNKDEEVCEEEIWLDESVVRKFRQGQGYYGLTMFSEARALFEQVVENEPDFLLGRIYLGLSEFQADRYEESRSHFRIVSKTGVKNMFVGFSEHMLGCIAVKCNEDNVAVKYFSKAVELLPENNDAWFNLGASYYRLGEYHEAIPNFYHALSLNEDDWEAMYYLSSCYQQYKEWESVSFWRLATYEKTKHPRVIESIAEDYEEMNDPDQAIQWYRRLLDVDKQNPKAFHGIAWNLWAKDLVEEALSWIKRGLSIFPEDTDLLFTYIWISMVQGDIEKAESALDNLPEDLCGDPIWIAVRSRLLSQKGNFDSAIIMAEQLIEQQKPTIQALGHYQKGRALMETGKGIEAIHHFQQAHQLNTKWKDPLFYEGICHMVDGRINSMLDCWNQLT